MSDPAKETYLGDGLYASFDGSEVTLRAPREGGDHYVVLDAAVLGQFLYYLAPICGREMWQRMVDTCDAVAALRVLRTKPD